MPVKISVIIVSYNSQDFIEECLASVLRYIPRMGEIIVIDNGSEDKTLEILEKFGLMIKLIKSDKNLGFSKANNLVSKEASGEYLFFLNPDTEINRPIFNELINYYDKTPDCGLVGSKLVMEDNQTQPSVRKLPTVYGAFKEYVLGMKGEYSEYVPDGNEPIEVEMVYGAAMLIRKDLFEKLNGFDEKYFLYYEDADLCKRVRESGKKNYYYPKVSIKHLVGATKSSQNRSKLNYESSVKYHGVIKAFILQLIFQIYRILNRFQ